MIAPDRFALGVVGVPLIRESFVDTMIDQRNSFPVSQRRDVAAKRLLLAGACRA